MGTNFSLPDTILLLSSTPAALDALVRHMPETWTLRNEGNGTWTVSDVIAHLIHGERTDWLPRTRIILQFGEDRTFDPFDRSPQSEENQGKTLAQLLDDFARLRSENLEALRELNLSDRDLSRTGKHPHFGVVTLSQLLATWAVHDLTHLHQISRIMAHQYRQEVGPWSAYLGALACSGHGA
ncbi:MAG: DinB family protein [Bryobacteraceae bacterium]